MMKTIVKIVVCSLFCALSLCLIYACGKTGKTLVALTDETTDNLTSEDLIINETTSAENGIITDIVTDKNNGVIETPYLNLIFDHALSDYLSVVHRSGNPYVLEFYAVLDNRPALQLFDILFGDCTNENAQTIHTAMGEITVSTIFYPFTPDDSWSQNEINTVFAMQEALNQLIEQIKYSDREAAQIPGNTPESTVPNNIEIIIPFCTLIYPEEWADYLKVDHIEGENYTLKFYAVLEKKSPVLLFSLVFGGDEGDLLGVVKNSRGEYVPTNLIMETFEYVDYTSEEMNIIYGMQESVNILIKQLPLE